MVVVAAGSRNRFHLVSQSARSFSFTIYTNIVASMHLTVEPTKRLSFNGCPLDCPPDISLESLRLLCTMQTSFDHPATMPTIRSPARIILPPPSVPDTQWHGSHPLRCPHPQSDVPWSYFSSHRHRTCNLPYHFVILLQLCLEAVPVHP